MEYRVLGPIEALDESRRLALGGPKQRLLLGVLLLRANRVVAGEDLVEALWADAPPATAGAAVQVYVSRLRKTLPEEALQTRPQGYVVRVAHGRLDAERFELLVRAGRRAPTPKAVSATLGEALALWRGKPLEGRELGGWAQAEAHRLAELASEAVEQRIAADLELGRPADLVAELETLVAVHPLRERLRELLMLALYRAGRQAEALEQFRVARGTLRDELGLEPGAALQELHRAILRHDRAIELPRAAPESLPAAILFAILTPSQPGDAAQVRELLVEAAEAASAELRRAGAHVDRGLAGALMARFDSGADPAADRAVAAARAVMQRLEPVGVLARIGIETGDVLVGAGGVTGEAVATASRLAGAARPGEILLGPEAEARGPRSET
jgi:DNA-binding SARP family transcriptional activator